MSGELKAQSNDSSRLKRTWIFISTHHEVIGVVLTFASVILAVLATVAAFWAVHSQNASNRELANQQNAINRELANQQNFFQFYQQWESDEMQERRARLATALLANRQPNQLDDSPLVFLETLSHASNQKLVDHDLTWNAFYTDLTSYWAAAREYALKVRKEENCECVFSELEKANNEFVAQASSKKGKSAASKEEHDAAVTRFLQWEANRRLAAQSITENNRADKTSTP